MSKNNARNDEIHRLRASGVSVKDIAKKFSIAKSFVYQILSCYERCPKTGDWSLIIETTDSFDKKYKDRMLRKYGVDSSIVEKLNIFGAPKKYLEQKKMAIKRNITWEFDLQQWWDVWESSGKWDLRGRKVGNYVMSRNGDVGPYSSNNVRIATCTENHRDRPAVGSYRKYTINLDEAYEMYMRGESMTRIAKSYNVSSQAVSALFKYHNKEKFGLLERRNLSK